MVAVSSLFSPTAISGVQWPLGPGSGPPLFFQSLEDLQILRPPPNPAIQDILKDLPATVNHLTTSSSSPEQGHFGRIALTLLLLGHGYTDECHNLVTPLCWPDDSHAAHDGPSMHHQVSPDVQAFATYTRCLVHRREAFNSGEFDANANYWFNAVQRTKDNSALPHSEWHSGILQLLAASKEDYYADHDPQIQSWCQQHGFVVVESSGRRRQQQQQLPTASTFFYFESRAVHELCAIVLRHPEENQHSPLRSFAEQVATQEVQILLRRALERAGIATIAAIEESTPTSSHIIVSNSTTKVDKMTAFGAIKRIFFRTLARFRG
jgi:hypothetical protein